MLSLIDDAPATLAPMRSLLGRSIAAALLLLGNVIVGVFLLIAHGQRLLLLRQVQQGTPVEPDTLGASDELVLLWSGLSLPIEIATAVAFLVWLYRANDNLRAFRAERSLEFTPSQAVTSFFIPFLNLVRPYAVVREVWEASDPAVAPPASVAESGGTWLVKAWWGLFIGRAVVGWWLMIATRGPAEEAALEALVSATYAMLGYCLVAIAAACAAIAVVVLIERRQNALGQALQGAPSTVAAS
jgi:hypothetical protein